MRIMMHLIEDMNNKGAFFAGYKNGNPVWTKYSVAAERWHNRQKAMTAAEKIANSGIPCKVVTDRRKVVAVFCYTYSADNQEGGEAE